MRFALIFGVLFLALIGCRPSSLPKDGNEALHQWFDKQSDSLLAELLILDHLATSAPLDSLKLQFRKSRAAYKKMEAITEYFFTGISKRVNGPPLPDVRTDDNQVFPPYGFQVVEQYLWSGFHGSLRTYISEEVRRIQIDIRYMQTNLRAQTILPRHVREALHHELIRIGTLGIAGFDTPLSGDFRAESIAALDGLQQMLKVYAAAENGAKGADDVAFSRVVDLLKQEAAPLALLTDGLMPLSQALEQVPFPETEEDRSFGKVFRGTLANLMTGKGFSPDQYAGYAAGKATPEKKQLGEKLFFDPILSKSTTISCASCHKPELAFTDGLPKAMNKVHGGSLPRNTPGLYYSSLQAKQFYDMRSGSLEDQVDQVMHNEEEFGLYAEQSARKISASSTYKALIRSAFQKDTLTALELRNALATYVRSLNPFRSAFDAYIRGDRQSMSASQQQGFNLFMGKAKCGTCHFIPVFNGTIPPWYSRSESEVIGVPEKAVWSNATIDKDPGRYAWHALDPLQHAFKTPGLRNISRTAPYMHNGVYKTLEDVVAFYHRGGGVGLGINMENQTLPFDSLYLTDADKRALVDFMHALTDH